MSNDRGVKNIVTIENDKKIEWYKNSHALVIGNGNYQKGWDKLPGAIEDAKKVAKALENNGFVVDLHLDLTKQEFIKILSEFVIKKGQAIDDRVLLYFAGHGFTEKLASGEDLGYLIMVDSDKPETDFLNFTLTSVDMDSLMIVAKKIRARHALFIFDSCFSGSLFNLREKVIPVKISETAMLPVRQFITAGQANEPVPDKSIFTEAFVDILQGRDKEPIPDGFLTGEELGLYLKTKVPEYNPNQHPQYGKLRSPNLDKGDFIFLLDGVKSSVVQTNDENISSGKINIEKKDGKKNSIEFESEKKISSIEKEFKKVMSYDSDAMISPNSKMEKWNEFVSLFLNLKKSDSRGKDYSEFYFKAHDRINLWSSLDKYFQNDYQYLYFGPLNWLAKKDIVVGDFTPLGIVDLSENHKILYCSMTIYPKDVKNGFHSAFYWAFEAKSWVYHDRPEEIIEYQNFLNMNSSDKKKFLHKLFKKVVNIEFHEKGVVAEDNLIRSKPLEVLDNNLENSIDKSSQNLLEMEFKYISPGTFMMGSPHSDENQEGDETYRKVTLTQGFYMGLTEVTQGQWLKIMKSNPSHFSECGENCPVENVTWSEVQEFIRILNERDKEGYIYRLPTEAEWEYSARGGDPNIYLSGDYKNYKSIAWSFENSGYRTCPVGRKNPNTNGLYDIIGNVWEYCQDYYTSDISEKETIDPIGPISGKGHVIRGNGYYDYQSKSRVANRDQIILGQRQRMLGFRLVRQKK